jgi:hypothetical protein
METAASRLAEFRRTRFHFQQSNRFENLRRMSKRPWISSLPFVLTVAVSSASLFVLQPMCARMVLPYLGGSYSVWTTCMLFFQAGLLGGYIYAHASACVGVRAHAVFHLALVAVTCFFLPPVIDRPDASEDLGSPVVWLLGKLVAEIGLPYLVLASSAPLLQVWFARSAFTSHKDPYFLYAASNAGSLLGLLAYPFLLEPLLSIRQQSYVWSGCFAVFAGLTSICAFILWTGSHAQNTRDSAEPINHSEADRIRPIGGGIPAKWLFLAFLPSSLLLSVTVHLTADVASIPLLWVLPLGVYLMTYILAFSTKGSNAHQVWNRWLPLVVLVIVVVLLTEATEPLPLIVLIHLFGLFWIGMVCHSGLARSRPHVAHLTTFYVCIAVGGALGGVFNALLAPAVFNSLWEYPAALALACFVPAVVTSQPASASGTFSRDSKLDILLPALFALMTFGLVFVVQRAGTSAGWWKSALTFGVPLIVCYTFSGRPIRFGLGIAALFLCISLSPGVHGEAAERVRSFFGVHRITRAAGYRLLVHGNTEHGRQSLDPSRRREPLAYYSRSGPIGELFGALSPTDSRLQNVAVLGLGAGATAAYAQPTQNWTFYEIDPAVVSLAWHQFTYLQDASDRGVNISISTGDARFQISRSPKKYGLIILDTFSSDSIPTHLFTREAFTIYHDRLTENGILAVHYSSRYFDLRPILGSLANVSTPPLMAVFREDLRLTDEEKLAGKAPSKWAILFQTWQDSSFPALSRKGWQRIEVQGQHSAWTDDHSNVLGALELSQPQ